MRATDFIHATERKLTGHRQCGHGPSLRIRDLASDLLGSSPVLATVLVLAAVAATVIGLCGPGASAVVVLDLVMLGLALAAVFLVLMAIHRADHTADLWATRHLAAARWLESAGDEILDELDEINSGLARLAARIETTGPPCRGSADAAAGE
jgi:hypothetical protein